MVAVSFKRLSICFTELTVNDTLQQMHAHRSIRSYQDKPIPDSVLTAILEAAWHGPTSINGQQVTLVVTKDAERRSQIAAIAGGQAWIAQAPVFVTLVIDFHKTRLGVQMAGGTQVIHESLEAFGVGAVDCGIALGRLGAAAQSLGLGIVPIGGIRRDPAAMVKLLGLPPLTFPLVGLAIGYPAEEGAVKPRLAFESYVHHETYDPATIDSSVAGFDAVMKDHWQTIGRTDGTGWSDVVRTYYQRVYFPDVLPVAKQQGFGFDK